MAFIVSTALRFPPYYYRQEELTSLLKRIWPAQQVNPAVLERIHHNVQVRGRHLAIPIEAYESLDGFYSRNNAWIEAAMDLGEQVVCSLLENTRLHPEEISQLAFTTVTGIAVPSIDARLMNRIQFSTGLKRMPLFGLGCAGGAAGIARLADYLHGHPDEAAILLSIELCSLTIQREDTSLANIVASGLFGDGAAAVLMVGSEHPLAKKGQPKVVDSQSVFFPDSEGVMGWEVRETGFKIVLGPDVAEVAQARLQPALEAFLRKHGLEIGDIAHWIAHPGGPKVIEGIENGLGLEPGALQISRECLAEVGNLSSASVLMVLQETLAQQQCLPGSYGLLLAMGPAFCAELVLLRW